MAKQPFWAGFRPNGKLITWAGVRTTRAEIMKQLGEGCMGAPDYYRLATDSARWAYLYRRGYRVKHVKVTHAHD